MNRRNFIKAGGGVFAIAAAGRALGANAPSNRVRLAMMGVGGRGFGAMGEALQVPGVEIAVVVDVDSECREKAAAKVQTVTGRMPDFAKDIREVLRDRNIDGIICCTPDHWHAPAAWMAMNAGKAVYVEKPCSFCPREGEILVETQRRTGQVFQMGNQRRASLSYPKAIEAIRNGVIGEPRWAKCWYMARRQPIGVGREILPPRSLDWELWQGPAPRTAFRDNVVPYKWHWFRRWGTGEAGNNAPHFLDVARWAMGLGFPERVTAGGGRLFYSGDDWAWPDFMNVTYEFPGRKCVTWEGVSCVSSRGYEGSSTGCMVYGLKGSVMFTAHDAAVIFDEKGKEVKRWNSDGAETTPDSLTTPISGLSVRHIGKFVDCIRNKDVNTNAPAPEAHASTILAHLANIAALSGETIRIDPITGKLAKGSAGADLWSREYEKGWEMS